MKIMTASHNIYINVLTHLRQKLFEKQLPEILEKQGIVFKINSTDDIVWDLVVIYEDIDEPWIVKHKENGLLFISGEPPMVKVYSAIFLNQFDYIISAHPEIKHNKRFLTQQSLPSYYGYGSLDNSIHYTFDDLVKMPIPAKSKKISFISSNRTFLPGHHSRVKFYEDLQKRYADNIVFYGKGFAAVNDKADAINPYYFSICVENSTIEDYWTEKITDAFLGYAVPVYYGCNNITSYFSDNSFIRIDIKDKKAAFSVIEDLIQNTEDIYKEKLPYLIESRNSCLYAYNTFYFILSFAEKNIFDAVSGKTITSEIQSSTIFHDNDFANKRLKAKRMLSKRINRIFKI